MFEHLIKDKTIITSNGEIKFKPVPVYFGRKVMDKSKSLENLKDFKNILDRNNITFGLIYGTLLGAVRENDFIDHDEDIDVFILKEDLDKVLSLLFDFEKIGFKIIRFKNDLLTISRFEEYIDINIFTLTEENKRRSYNVEIDAEFLEDLTTVVFKKITLKIPKNYKSFLTFAYGNDWKIPKRSSYATIATGKQSFNRKVAKVLPKKISYYVHLFLLIIRK